LFMIVFLPINKSYALQLMLRVLSIIVLQANDSRVTIQ